MTTGTDALSVTYIHNVDSFGQYLLVGLMTVTVKIK